MAGPGITPDRKTRVIFDVAETITVSPFQGWRRRGDQVAPKHAAGQMDDDKFQNLRVWATGAVTLDPLQTEITNITEYVVGASRVLFPDPTSLVNDLSRAGILALEYMYRQNDDLPGFAASGNIQERGGPFIVKKVKSGETWESVVGSGVPSMLSGPAGADEIDIPFDRVGESKANFPTDQPFFLNWSVPGKDIDYPNFTLGWYFGQFGIAFSGSGVARLYENVLHSVDYSQGWVLRARWKYARTGQVAGTSHSMAIWPHLGPQGQRFLAFTNGQVDFAQATSSFARTGTTSVAPGDYIYTVKSDPRYVDQAPGHVTKSGPIRFDIRRDLRLAFQPSTLGFPTTGLLIDDPGCLPNDSTGMESSLVPLRLFADVVSLPGTGVVSTLIDAATGAPYDPALPFGHPAAKFAFFGDGNNTPILWGYNVNRDSLSQISAPGEFSGGNLRSVSVTGYSGDPSQVSAQITIEDVRGELLRLQNRGQFRTRIEVDHVEGGQTITTPIFQGYTLRPHGEKRGKPGRVYPSPDWYKWDLPMLSMWMRLAEPTSGPLLQNLFYNDLSVPDDQRGGLSFIPWKVTDALRYLIGCAGFAPDEIRIPDVPIRLWPGMSDPSEFDLNPNTDYAELALKMCRNFLGAYLMYDESCGWWTILEGTRLDAAPLYHFTTLPPDGQRVIAPGAYGPNTTFITHLSLETVPPEFNFVHVACPVPDGVGTHSVVEQFAYNYHSCQFPGSPFSPDPNHPDYIGHLRPCAVVDPSLYSEAGPDTEALTQAAVDWTCRRLFDFCCHGQRLVRFESPLVFLLDPITNVWRMPRFQDPITINGQPYLIKAVTVNYTLGCVQMMNVEAIQPVAGQYVPPGIESLTFYRKSLARNAVKTAGSSTQSQRLGNLSISPHVEQQVRHLPRLTHFQYPLQDPSTGEFGFMLGYDPLP